MAESIPGTALPANFERESHDCEARPSSEFEPVVILDGVRVHYGSYEALQGIEISLPKGATGLVGRNGAGKSTLMRLLLGLIPPSAGTGKLLGMDLNAPGWLLRRKVGFMPENDAFLLGMKGLEQVALAGELCGLGQRQSIRRAHEVLTYVGLGEARYRNVENYSTGMKQRLKLAAALVHDPQLLLLDEPTVGLDPPGRQRMLDLIDDLVDSFDKSLVISTHLLDDIQQTCEHVVMIERGKVLFSGKLDDLMKYEQPQYRLRWEGNQAPFVKALEELGAIRVPDSQQSSLTGSLTDCEIRVSVSSGFDIRQFFHAASRCNVRLRTLESNHEDLTDLYHRLLRKGGSP